MRLFRHYFTVLLTILALLSPALPLPAAADGAEAKAVAQAYKYYRRDKRRSFRGQAKKISGDSVYRPLIQYWESIIALRGNKPQATEQYIATAASPYLQGEARRQLLEYYVRKKQWQSFNQHAEQGGACAASLKALFAGALPREQLMELWHADSKMTQPLCLTLYKNAHRLKVLTHDDVWVKLRALAGNKRLGPARRLLKYFRGYVPYSKVRSVVRRATRYIRGKHGLRTRAERELVMIAAMVAVRKNPKTAIGRWQQFSQYFSPEENDHVWTVLATWAARWHRDDALAMFAATSGQYADEQARAWRTRAALRAGDYRQVTEAIDTMPVSESRLSAWRYWYAVALQRQDAAAARQQLTELARDEDDYYGLLAREAVGAALIPARAVQPLDAAAPVNGDFELALAVYEAGLNSLARAIWRHAARRSGVSDSELLAAAERAAQSNWPLASIDAADRASDAVAAHYWRFPLPYREQIIAQSEKRGLDLAFVYGLIRQESRFMPRIVSSANAQGLMQVIPSTARSVARKNGYTKYRLSRLKRVDTNVIIGTTYLQELAGRLKAAPAMVAAAYNAGPTRVKRWYSASSDILIAIENIPITETRLYVKYVLANRLHYNHRLQQEVLPMTENIVQPMRGRSPRTADA